jgi:hypothetical protein
MRNLLPYGVVVLVVTGAAFTASYLMSGRSQPHHAAPAIEPLMVRKSGVAIPGLSNGVTPFPTALAVTTTVAGPSTSRVVSPHPVVAPPESAPTTTIILHGGTG